jgi:hypothetical protein
VKRLWLVAAAITLAGCGGSSGTFVHVDIARDGTNADITHVDLALSLDGKPAATTLSEPGGGAIAFPTSVTLSIGNGQGLLDVVAIGRNAGNQELARDESSTTVKSDETSSLKLTLRPMSAATGDMAAADLLAADLAGIDLASTPDLASSPDLATDIAPDLSMPMPIDMAAWPPDMTNVPPPDLATLPPTPPSAPRTVSATPSDSAATVTWAAPSLPGSSSVIRYTVTATPGGNAVATPDGSTLHATITGLTNGTSYTFVVVATNSAGNSLGSDPSAGVVPAGVPVTVAGVTASPTGPRAINVSWPAPSANGSAITSYVVTPAPSGTAVTVTTTQASFSVLTVGTAYTFTVVAKNAIGPGVASAPSNSVVAGDIPTQPLNVNAVLQSDGSVVVTWAAPTSNGYYPITDYTMELYAGGGVYDTISTSALTFTHGPPNISVTEGYEFYVFAHNAMGTSGDGPSNTLYYTAPPLPATPIGLTVIGNGSVCVSWNTVPGASSYVVNYSMTAGSAKLGKGTSVTSTTPSVTVDGLTKNATYYFAVGSVNSAGRSVNSGEVTSGFGSSCATE